MLLNPNILVSHDISETQEAGVGTLALLFAKAMPGALCYFPKTVGSGSTDVLGDHRYKSLKRMCTYTAGHLTDIEWSLLRKDFKDAVIFGATKPSVYAKEHIQYSELAQSHLVEDSASSVALPRNADSFTDAFLRLTFLANRIDIVDPYLSASDTDKGYKWLFDAIEKMTSNTKVCLTFHICLSDEKQQRKWSTTRKWITEWRLRLPWHSKLDIRAVNWNGFHDRFVITERHVVDVPSGLGLSGVGDGKAKTNWTVMNPKDADVIRNEFQPYEYNPHVVRTDGWARMAEPTMQL